MGRGGVPTGTVISGMWNSAPAGYLKCDGTVYNITAYPRLAASFEAEFGTKNYFGGDGAITFAVPDLRGEFLRGTGTNSHADQGSGDNVGVHQDGTQVLNFDVDGKYNAIGVTYIENEIHYALNSDSITRDGNARGFSNFSGHYSIGTSVRYFTIRPTTTSVLYCIKT